MTEPLASQAGHWYRQDGSPCYQVPCSDPRKGMRDTTLTDARKFDLVPSVTKIIRCAAAIGLETWKQNQILDSALTLPMLPGELADAYKMRVIMDAEETGKKARERGTELHAAIESVIQTGECFDLPQWKDHCVCIVETMKQYGIDLLDMQAKAEHSFARDGYGGKIDWHDDMLLLDFKSKYRIDKVKPYDEHLMQCAAYAYGVGVKRAGNVFIGVEDKQVRVFMYEPEQLTEAFGMFTCLLSFWQRRHRFGPYSNGK